MKPIKIKMRHVFLDEDFTDADRIFKLDAPDIVNQVLDKMKEKEKKKNG